jgi:isopenicillin N synthase-like dioxygenase
VLDYWRECDRVATVLLAAMAEILGVRKEELLQLFIQPLTNMTLLHYPPQAAEAAGFGIHPHKDTDALTILAPDPVGGLFVKRRDESGWIRAAAPENALIVNVGDLLELWSGGYFVSTPHKVVNSSGQERYSFPYFVVPRFDTVVRPLRAAQADFQRSGVHVGDVSREVWRTNWPDTMPQNPHFDLGTLAD